MRTPTRGEVQGPRLGRGDQPHVLSQVHGGSRGPEAQGIEVGGERVERRSVRLAVGPNPAPQLLDERLELITNEERDPRGRAFGGVDPTLEFHPISTGVGKRRVSNEPAVPSRDRALKAACLLVQELFARETGAEVGFHDSCRRG